MGNGAEETEAAPKGESKKITSVKPMATAEPFGGCVILGAATKEAVLPVPAATGSAFSINGTGGMFVVLVAWFSTVEAHRKPDNIGGSLKETIPAMGKNQKETDGILREVRGRLEQKGAWHQQSIS